MGQQSNNSLEGQLSQYTTPLPDVAQAYLRSFRRGGPIDMPTFQELYGSYRDVAEREAGRQSNAISESFGQRGARYGSDILNAQNSLRQNLAQDLRNSSAGFLTQLRSQQFNEALPLAQLQFGASEAGMARLFSDFLRRTGVPPLLEAAGNLSQSYGLPTKVVF